MAGEGKGRLRVSIGDAPDSDPGWYATTEISIRDNDQFSYVSELYFASDHALIQVGLHEPSDEKGISCSTLLEPKGFITAVNKIVGGVPNSTPVEVHASAPLSEEGYVASGVFFELEDYLDGDAASQIVDAVHIRLGGQLVRWSSADIQHGMTDIFARVEVRAAEPDTALISSLLGETACSSLAPQFDIALTKLEGDF